ncbi:MAG TPA: hypothetical protein VF008_32395, partial [Niastella sp.]
MKKLTLFFMVFSFLATAYASNEKLYVLRSGSFWEENYVNIDPSNPCTEFAFKVTYTIPAGFNAVERFDWYVNNVLLRSTTDVTGGYGGTTIRLSAPIITVVCKVIYKNGSTVSAPVASDEYRLEALLNPYTVSGLQVVDIGNQTVTYSLSKTGSGRFYYDLPLSSFSVAWECPAGWTLLSTNGVTATFATDTYSGGTVKATLTATGCGYQERPRELNVTRNYPPVSFTNPYPPDVCYNSPSGTYSINPQPAAISYTYAIYPYSGDASGVVFAANSQQTLTTTTTSTTINFNTSADLYITLGVKANYGNGVSSAEATQLITYRATVAWPGFYINVNYTPNDCYGGWFTAEAPYVSGATYYWYMDGQLVDIGGYITNLDYRGQYVLSVQAKNNCASTDFLYQDINYGCGCCMAAAAAPDANSISVYPNPTISEVSLNVKNTVNSKTGKGLKEIRTVKILDKFGNV